MTAREYYARLNGNPHCASELRESIKRLPGYDYFKKYVEFVSPNPEKAIFAVKSRGRMTRTRIVFKLTMPKTTPEREAERLTGDIKGLELIPV